MAVENTYLDSSIWSSSAASRCSQLVRLRSLGAENQE